MFRRSPGAGKHFKLVGFVKTKRKSITPRVPFPLTVGNEARAARETLAVVSDDALRGTA
jgi:hypothetical protein